MLKILKDHAYNTSNPGVWGDQVVHKELKYFTYALLSFIPSYIRVIGQFVKFLGVPWGAVEKLV